MSTLPMRAGGALAAITPQSFEDVQRLARMALQSGLFKGDRKDTDEAKFAKACMCVMQGLEAGVPPMQALQGMAVINGRVTMYGDLLTALLWAKGCRISQTIEGEGDARTATCTITRPDGATITRTFSVADAKRAKLWDDRPTITKFWDGKQEQKPNDSPWFRFPDRMLGWRALGFAQKDGAADFTRGIVLHEEHADMIDVTPTDEPKRKKSSAGAKRDGTDRLFAEIVRHIRGAGDAEALAYVRSTYADEWETMPTRWYELLEEEYATRAKDLGPVDQIPDFTTSTEAEAAEFEAAASERDKAVDTARTH